jgi:hypothetical protein
MGVLIDYTKNQNEEGFVFYETSEDFFSIWKLWNYIKSKWIITRSSEYI